MANLKRPELKLTGNISENFKNFELRFNDFCIQAGYRNLDKDPIAQQNDHYKNPLMEISALRSSLPDEALQVIRYTIEPQIAAGDQKKPWVWMDHLRTHYTGSIGSTLLTDRFKFWTACQSTHESVQDWEVRVRQLGGLCEYEVYLDEMCRDKFIFGLHDENIRKELLKTHRKPDTTKKKMCDVVSEARAMESAHKANKLIADTSKTIDENAHWVRHRDMQLKREPGTCHWCGDKKGPHPWKNCPAKGRTCAACGGNDHFARVCQQTGAYYQRRTSTPGFKQHQGRGRGNYNKSTRGRPRQNPPQNVNLLQAESDNVETYYDDGYDDEQCFTIDAKPVAYTYSLNESSHKRRYFANLSMSSTGRSFSTLKFQLDTAATCNTLSEAAVATHFPDIKFSRSPYLLHPYGDSKPIRPMGQIKLICDRNGKFHTIKFQVLPEMVMKGKPALLSGTVCEKLGLVQVDADEVYSLAQQKKATENDKLYSGSMHNTNNMNSNDVTSTSRTTCKKLPPLGKLTKDDILQNYSENFEGIGLLGPPVHFDINPDITPIQMPIHRVPIPKRDKEKQAIDNYVKSNILKKVDEPTAWCSNILCRESPNKFRVCIDPSHTVNKAINRPIYQMSTLNEQLHKLCNAKCFSVVDVREGFLHVPLDEESSYMTTMHTSFGRYRWLRLPFGITSAPEEFQNRLNQALEGLEGCLTIADDILIYGEGDNLEDAEKNHDRRFIALMERAMKENIKFQPNKLKFKLKELKFVGNILTANGMKADPDKVAAIVNMAPPKDKAGLLRFIGMVNYLSPYCDNLSKTIRPLTQLTQNGVPFNWSVVQQAAFDKAKEVIVSAPVLAYYDLKKPVVLQVDASDSGLGAALLQPNDNDGLQPVAYSSCSLSQTEQRYSQIEKECLAICNAFAKFDQWLYGKSDIMVHTDHQPLETIMKKPLNKAPARLQRMLMRLQRYRFKVAYRKGSSLHLADTLSRAALPKPIDAQINGFEVFRVDLESQFQEVNQRLFPETEIKLREETRSDPALSQLYHTITHGWPTNRNLLPDLVKPYWGYRDELTIQNGIIYKGTIVLVPPTMRKEMLGKIHTNHFGAESNIRMAREVLFWPGMRKSIQDMCEACSTCAKYNTTAPKEPMKHLPIPTLPWQIISQDLGELEAQPYLITVCHFSDWIEVDKLDDTLSSTIINHTKAHFARYGVPKICHTDNGPQFSSKEYANFEREYEFKHTTSSPYHPKGNGRAEAAVKVAKSMLKKSTDFLGALLLYRNTPPKGHTYSPAQRMFGRRTRTTLPTTDQLLIPEAVNIHTVMQDIKNKRSISKEQYDKTAGSELQPVKIGDHVYVKPPPAQRGKPWIYGQVIANEGPRSYTVSTGMRHIRRNRTQVRPAAPPSHIDVRNNPLTDPNITVVEPNGIGSMNKYPKEDYIPSNTDKTTDGTVTNDCSNNIDNNMSNDLLVQPEGDNPTADSCIKNPNIPQSPDNTGQGTRRSSRATQPPLRLNDYVMK